LRLHPLACSNHQRAMRILRGFHGLHIYAQEFWTYHLLEFCALNNSGDLQTNQLPAELSKQLEKLLDFKKPSKYGSTHSQNDLDLSTSHDLSTFTPLPRVKDLLLATLAFRKAPKPKHALDQSQKGMHNSPIVLHMLQTLIAYRSRFRNI
jgi:hypothetical protein